MKRYSHLSHKKKKNIKIFKWITYTIAITTMIAYLIGCMVPFINSGDFWLSAIPGLLFLYLLFALIVIVIIAWVTRSHLRWIATIVLLLGFQQIAVLFAWHLPQSWRYEKEEKVLRILSWNVSSWDISNYTIKNGRTFQPIMYDLIKEQHADVLCFQEFFTCTDPLIIPSYISPFKDMGYPFHYFSPVSYTVDRKFQTGLAIFSKFPIGDTAFVTNISAGHSEGFSYADITKGQNTFRVFNTHLESVGFNSDDYQAVGKIKGSRTIMRKMRNSYEIRNIQAQIIRKEIDRSPHPAIVCSDADDVPNSSAYFTLKGNLQDAFLKRGSGLGRTFRFISPNLRIDYIFASQNFLINQFSIQCNNYSDHCMLLTDIEWK